MEKIVTFTLEDKGIKNKEQRLNFIAERLKPFEQFNLILKIISIVAKGNSNSEQALHNIFQTGKEVENVKSEKDIIPLKLILDGIKGALAELSDIDRDYLINQLLKNTKIDCGQSYIVQANQEELNKRCSSFQPIFKLLKQAVKINFGFL